MYFLVIFVFRENIMLFGTRQLLLFKFIISLSDFSNTWTPPSRNNDETSLTLICVVKISFFSHVQYKVIKKIIYKSVLDRRKDKVRCEKLLFLFNICFVIQHIFSKKLFQTSCQFYCQFFHIKFSLDLVKWFFFIVFHRKIW